MEGLEGLKILSECLVNPIEYFMVLFLIGGALALSFLFIAWIEGNKQLYILGTIIGISTIILGIIMVKEPNIRQLKVTPIEDRYYIDLNKWNIINTESEIITIEEKVKKND